MTSPTFADIVQGRHAVAVVHADAHHVAWLAERPAREGHVIVATRRVVDAVWDLPPDEHAALWACVRMLAQRQRERLPCARVCVSVIGWVVRHAHVHLVPTDAPGQVPGLDGPPLPPERQAQLQQCLSVPESRDGRC
ncbi:MAG: HIT family protein [Planctomycetes bacterium]|nr:HIT family protein [Planctomycetota bacterium]